MLNSTNICEPIFLRNLIIYPISSITKDGSSPLTIDETMRLNRGEFHELETPDINKIVFENRGNDPVLVLDGEEITGSLQNRIIAMSHFVEARSSKNIPVVCVEEERWKEIGGFETGHCSYPRIRTILAKSRYQKIDTQRVIWNEINRKLAATKTISTTSSMHDIYTNLQDEISRYVEDFQELNHNTIGFVGVAGNRMLGCDIFANSFIYRKFENKLIRSYVLDAIEYQKKKQGVPDVQKFVTAIQGIVGKKNVKGKSRNIKIKGDGFLGQALIHNTHPIHISAFPT